MHPSRQHAIEKDVIALDHRQVDVQGGQFLGALRCRCGVGARVGVVQGALTDGDLHLKLDGLAAFEL